jgi:hypothetical protein
MTADEDPYMGRDSKRCNSPIGHARSELVYLTAITGGEDDKGYLQLSGSPIEYFVHSDYRNMAHYVTGTYKFGVAGLYDHAGLAWLSPDTYVYSVSRDGYTIHLTGSHGLAIGDVVEVYYYARDEGPEDWRTAAQTGDPLMPETFDACTQKINDCPSLDFENSGLVFNAEMAYNTLSSPSGLTTAVRYSPGTGTWHVSDLPFYVTGIFFAWEGDSFVFNAASGGFGIDVDSGANQVISASALGLQSVMKPLNTTGSSLLQSCWLSLGLLEIDTDLHVKIDPHATFVPSTMYCVVMGWHLP